MMIGSSFLSPGEREAEVIYTRAVYGKKYTMLQACADARKLEAYSPEGAMYLKWLLERLGKQQAWLNLM